eukprot:14526179-Alexandrium_andersonii.AAC.1
MHPCTDRSADVVSEGMYWADRSGAFMCIADTDPDWKNYCGFPEIIEGALGWLGVLWKMKQGCWYPSDEVERVAGEEILKYWDIWSSD